MGLNLFRRLFCFDDDSDYCTGMLAITMTTSPTMTYDDSLNTPCYKDRTEGMLHMPFS